MLEHIPQWLSRVAARWGRSAPTFATKTNRRFVPSFEALEARDVPALLATTPVPVGNAPRAVVVADFNGDKKPDLFSVDEGSTFSCELGSGDGHFTHSQSAGIGGPHIALAVLDYNGDGKKDVVAVNLQDD